MGTVRVTNKFEGFPDITYIRRPESWFKEPRKGVSLVDWNRLFYMNANRDISVNFGKNKTLIVDHVFSEGELSLLVLAKKITPDMCESCLLYQKERADIVKEQGNISNAIHYLESANLKVPAAATRRIGVLKRALGYPG